MLSWADFKKIAIPNSRTGSDKATLCRRPSTIGDVISVFFFRNLDVQKQLVFKGLYCNL